MTPPRLDHERRILDIYDYGQAEDVLSNSGGEFSRDVQALLPPGAKGHPTLYFMWLTDPGSDGRHTFLRGLVEGWFRGIALQTMAPRIREYARDVRQACTRDGRLNLVDYGYRLALRTICGLVGYPLDYESALHREMDRAGKTQDLFSLELDPTVRSIFWETIAKRLANPQGELLDLIIQAWQAGKISDEELLGFQFGLLSAGRDTTGTAMVDAMAVPSELGWLEWFRGHLADEQALDRGLNEVIRFASTSFPIHPAAYTVKPYTVSALEVPAGTRVVIHLSATNFAPAVNGRNTEAAPPSKFDPERSPNRHLSFGQGPHHCLGRELALLELRIGLRELLEAGYRLDPDAPFSRYVGLVDGVSEAYCIHG